jgi:hypothetical protein
MVIRVQIVPLKDWTSVILECYNSSIQTEQCNCVAFHTGNYHCASVYYNPDMHTTDFWLWQSLLILQNYLVYTIIPYRFSENNLPSNFTFKYPKGIFM